MPYRRVIGFLIMITGCIGALYGLFSIYTFLWIKNLLYFAHASHGTIAFFTAFTAMSVILAIVGYRLTLRS